MIPRIRDDKLAPQAAAALSPRVIVNGLRLAPPVPSIFEDGFGLE